MEARLDIVQDARETFRFAVRVYYEDTDAGGIVYYANYLKFMERARTEWLESLGFALSMLEERWNVVFVVHHLDIAYRQPARLGDALDVTLALVELHRARLVATQDVRNGERVLTHARVTLACLGRPSLKPTRIPAPLHTLLASLL